MNRTLILIYLLVFLFAGNLYSQNFWQQTNGPYSSRARCLYCKSSTGMLFAGTNLGGGIYRSSDNGATWQKTSVGLEGVQIRQFTAAPNGDIFAAAWNPTAGTPPNLLGVYRSSDDGASWQLTSLDSLSITSLGVNPAGEVFAAVDYPARLWRTSDNGASWVIVNSLPPTPIADIAVNKDGIIFCAGNLDIVKSTDNGITWINIEGSGVNGSGSMAIDSTGHIYVSSFFNLYKSNGDANWVNIMSNVSIGNISISPKGGIYVSGTGGKILRSSDGGDNWIQLSQVWPTYVNGASISEITFDFSGSIYVSLDYLGIVKSTNGGFNWTRTNNGITNCNISALAASHTGRVFAGSWNDGLFITTDRGVNWSTSILPGFYVMSINFDNAGNALVTGFDSTGSVFYRSTNEGLNWTKVTANFPQNGCYKIVSNSGGMLFAGLNTGIYRSSDNGITWTHITPNNSTYARDLLITQDGNIWACTNEGLLRSTTNGDSWTKIDSLVLPGNQYCIVKLAGGEMLLSTFQNLYRSVNGGINWTLINNTRFAYLIPSNDGAIYGAGINLVGNTTVYKSTDVGFNWVQLNTGLLNMNVTNIALDSLGFLYAGSEGSSVYRSTGSLLYLSNTGNTIPAEFHLSQNYPNPFNPVTKINFAIPSVGNGRDRSVKLVIYDILGREVAILINQQMQPGSYSVDWDASNYPSGVYFYKLESGDYVQTKKMVLLK